MIGSGCIGWRYDPIFISERYTKEYHLRAFSQIAEALEGYTDTVVISFIDLYHKRAGNQLSGRLTSFHFQTGYSWEKRWCKSLRSMV